jgi:hypothetical protein
MFIGHYALAFAARPQVRKPGLGTLIFAVSWVDLLWPLLLLAGIETVQLLPGSRQHPPIDFLSYPWSHSLFMDLVWAGLLALVLGRAWARREQVIFGALVVSHWVLDWLSHRPDMPLWPGSARYGLGLWNHLAATIAVEVLLFAACLATYLRATRAKGRAGHWSLWSFVAFMGLIYIGDMSGGAPPPNVTALGIFGLLGWLGPLWGMWIERTREAVEA